ncbi:MAG TPA: hypothetical protein PKM88_15285, partial [bacterium]|nr:hypothetical protein [bacterium]
MDTTAGADTIAPAAPASVWAAAVSTTACSLSWSASVTNEEVGGSLTDLAGYRIYRALTPNPGNWGSPIGSAVAGVTGYADSPVHGLRYYRVTAYDNHSPWENESWYSDSTVSVLVNAAPRADAGNDTFMRPTSFPLMATASGDSDGDPLSYAWTQLAGTDSAGLMNFTTPTAIAISGIRPGTYVFQVTVSDSWSSAADSITVTVVDSATPAIFDTSVIIAGDTAWTTNAPVTLALAGDTQAYQMRIGNDSAFTGSSWETYAATKSWNLGDTNGLRAVYVQFRNWWG